MGYNLKTPWDLAEFKKEAIPHIAPIAGSSSFVDLKLGRFGDPGEGLVDNFKAPRTSMMESASCGSSRRARARLNGTQTASCLVDGCRSDLSACRDYHRRHKVCEVHSKTPIVTIAGQEKRFCQQCSRFHSLVEFDEGKRSCRKRLDGHNRRRRKPQPESLSLNPGRFHSNHPQGTRYLPFSRPQVCTTGSVDSSVWAAGVVKAENDPVLNEDSHSLISFSDRKSLFPGILSHSYKGGKQFPFLQGSVSSALAGESVNQPVLDPNSVLGNGSSSNQKMFTDGLHRVFNSDCALSLLSSPPVKTREVGFNPMHQLNPNPNPSPPSHSLIPTFQHYNNLRPQVDHAGSILVSDGSSSASLHSQEMFHMGLDGSSTSMSHPHHQTLSFSWE